MSQVAIEEPLVLFPRAGRLASIGNDGTDLRIAAPVSIANQDGTQALRNEEGDLQPRRVSNSNGDHLLDAYREGLGEDFRETSWKKPSEVLAREHRVATMYIKGRADLCGTADTSLFQMGEGVGLYFIYIRRMILFAVWASILTLPHLLICYYGEGLTQAEMDPLRLLTFAAGNHRFANISDSTSVGYHPCTSGGNSTVNTLFADGATCDDQFMKLSHNPEVIFTSKSGSYIIAVCDVLCCLVFMVIYWRFSKEITMFEERADRENVTPADYAVKVRGLPEDAQDEEVIRHFSELFRLDQPGWQYRGWCCCRFGRKYPDNPEDVIDCAGVSIGDKLKPVEDTKHSRFDHICKGSWLAECVLAHPEGAFIRQAKAMTAASERILTARALVKKVRGTRRSRLRRSRLRMAERRLAQLQKELANGAQELTSRAQKFELISWKTSSAFVVFNHEASVTRCLADYTRYPVWLQPKQLRFRGVNRLRVTRAPEAGNILWENLELTNKQRARRKTLTLSVTIVLLGVSFAVLSVSNIAERVFNSTDSEMEERCLITIPEQHGRPAQTPYIGVDSDDRCADNELWVSVEGSPYQSTRQKNRCVEPCVDTTNTNTMDCGDGIKLTQYHIATCLCRQEMEEEGIGAIQFVRDAGGGCWAYATKYYSGQLLTLVASTNIVVINFGLKHALKRMGAFERHPSVTEQAISTSWKIALALFINSACVVLLVNVPATFAIVGSSDTQNAARMASEAADSADWYTTTGEALITTMAINVVAPRMPDLVEGIFAGPWRRRKESSSVAITQKQLNNNWKGRNFDLSSRLPITLMMMAVAVTFSPALPVLFPMVSLYLACTYFGEKFYLLRVCRTPPQYDGRIVKMAVGSMPWMLACHCLFALFAFSRTGVFGSDSLAYLVESDQVQDTVGVDESTTAISTSLRLICLPFAIMLALIFAYVLFSNTIGRVLRLIWSIVSCRCFMGSTRVNIMRLNITNPTYTGVFERGYPLREAVPKVFSREFDWLIREDAKGCQFLTRAHSKKSPTGPTAAGRRNGTAGPELMLTWEVLQSIYPTHTFHIEDNPAYQDIVVTRNVIAKKLGISTPKSPGGKLWSPADYRAYVGKGKGIRRAVGKVMTSNLFKGKELSDN